MTAPISTLNSDSYGIVSLSLNEIDTVSGADGVVSDVTMTVGVALVGGAASATVASGGTLTPATVWVALGGAALIGVSVVADQAGY